PPADRSGRVPRAVALPRRRRHAHRVRGGAQVPRERGVSMPHTAGLADLSLLSEARTFSISAEYRDGRPGGGGRAPRGDYSTAWASHSLQVGWKTSITINLEGHSSRTFARIDVPVVVKHL